MTLETATAPVAAADNTPLTIEQHVELMSKPAPAPRKAKEPAPAAEAVDETPEAETVESPEGAGETVEDAQDTEADPQSAEGAEDEPTEANVEGDEEREEAEPAPPAIEPPKFWDAEGKESFAKLAPKEQQAVLKYEEQRTKAVAKAMQESAETRKAAEASVKHLKALADDIGERFVDPGQAEVAQWEKALAEWDDWFASDDALELSRTNRAAYDEQVAVHKQQLSAAKKAKRTLDEAVEAKNKAEAIAFAKYAEREKQLINELVPELADEAEGGKRKSELFTYLREEGFEPDRLRGISAKEVQLAWKARKLDQLGDIDALVRDAEAYRKSMKLAAKAPPPKPKPQAGPSAPATGQGQRLSSSETRFKALNSKHSLSAAEHTELMLLKAKLRK